MKAYLDASVLLPSLVAEPTTAVVRRSLLGEGRQLLVSEFADAEVASALSRLVRTRSLGEEQAIVALTDYDSWRATTTSTVELQTSDARMANLYVRRFETQLRAPDALHLAVVHRLGATLVTFDARLARAARTLGIEAEDPSGPER